MWHGARRLPQREQPGVKRIIGFARAEPTSLSDTCSLTLRTPHTPLTAALVTDDAPYQEEIQKLDAQIEEHKAVKLMVTELDKRQVEYDHYVGKLRHMSSAPGDRLAANEHKLKVAQEHLDSCTSSLVRILLRASPSHSLCLSLSLFPLASVASRRRRVALVHCHSIRRYRSTISF